MNNSYKNNWKIYNAVFIIITILVSVPSVFLTKNTGLDPSWRFAINKFFNEGLVFGEDIVFTYGPLGFFTCCTNEGFNILFTFVFWAVMLLVHAYLMYQWLFKVMRGEQGFLVFLSLFLYAVMTIINSEYYVCYICLTALLLTMKGYKKNIYIFSVIFMLSAFIKFNIFIMLLMIMIIYLIFGYFHNKAIYKYCLPRMFLGLVFVPLVYFILSGFSFTNFINYIKGSIEISSGYNSAMSAMDYDVLLIWILIAAVLFLICMIISFKSGFYNFILMVFIASFLFMSYKHGFVRADGHSIVGMNGMVIFLSAAIMFLDWKSICSLSGRYKNLYIGAFCIVVSIAAVQSGFEKVNIVSTIRDKVFNLPITINNMISQNDKDVNPLPQNYLQKIGNRTVSIYPWEVSYCISNELNYVPLATIQAYSTYTPYLDEISAEKFLNDDAPEFIIFSIDTIDDRWAFIECPQTWEAIRNNYYVEDLSDTSFLLKRKGENANVNYDSVRNYESGKYDEIHLDEADYLKIEANLSLKGKLAKMLWKIPPVYMEVHYSDGRVESHRVLLDMFSEGVELGSILRSREDLIDLLNDTGHQSKVSYVKFDGLGLSFYDDIFTVKAYKTSKSGNLYPSKNIKTAYSEEITGINFSEYKVLNGAVTSFTDSEIGNDYYKKTSGWAYITEKADDAGFGDICVESGGKYYKCNEIQRTDVQNTLGLSSDMIGYVAQVDSADNMTVCIIDTESKIIYK